MDKEQLLQEGFKEIKLISAKDNKTIIFNDYMINREGKVWSFRTSKPKILDGAFYKGYKKYNLYTTENGKSKKITVRVHVLIASTFLKEVKINNIGDKNTFEVVHHINHNSKDNRPLNLLWISKVEHDQLHSKSDITRQRMSENHKWKPVIAFTDSGSYYKEFVGIRDAERELGIKSTNICKCVKGKIKSAGKITINGVIEKIKWRYK